MRIIEAIRATNFDERRLSAFLQGVRPEDLAEEVADLSNSEILQIFQHLEDSAAAEFLYNVGPNLARYLVAHSSQSLIVTLLARLPMDDAAYVISEIEPQESQILLAALEMEAPVDAAEIRNLLSYHEKTAGRLMTDKYIRLTPEMNVQEVFHELRNLNSEVETVSALYVVDGTTLIGVVTIHDLILARSDLNIQLIMKRDFIIATVDTDQAAVARQFAKYDLLALPILDRGSRFVGIVTVDDVLDVLVEEFNDDVAKFVGTDAEEMDRRNPAQIARMRLPWLLGTMIIELSAGLVIARYHYVLTEVVLLASFMPVVSAISGNVGLQAAAIVVRGLDTGHISLERKGRAVRKELLTSLLLAGVCGAILGAIGWIWSRHLFFGIVIGIAMFASMLTAGFMGAIIPTVSKRFGFDPATTAGPFETAFQDVVGFGVLLWVASMLLPLLK